MRLDQSFRLFGYWYLPGAEDKKLPGILTCDKNAKATLELFGSLEGTMLQIATTHERIVGITENGHLVTLERCIYQNVQHHFPGMPRASLIISIAVFNIGFEKDEKITFDRLRIELEGLNEWLDVSGFNVSHDIGNSAVAVQYKPPSELKYKLSDGRAVAFLFQSLIPSVGHRTSLEISQKSVIEIAFNKSLELAEVTEFVYRLNNLFCFLIGNTVSLKKLNGYNKNITEEVLDATRDVEADIYYRSIPTSEKKASYHSYEMLLPFAIIKDSMGDLFEKWFAKYELLEPVFNLYFAVVTNAKVHIEIRFLYLVQGLESLHRRTSDKSVMPAEEFEQICKSLISSAEKEKVAWLKGKLRYANELSLRDRLSDLCKAAGDIFESASDKLINKVVDTRNYLTHFDARLRGQAAGGIELYWLSVKLEILLQMLIFRELELPANVQDQISQKLKLKLNRIQPK